MQKIPPVWLHGENQLAPPHLQNSHAQKEIAKRGETETLAAPSTVSSEPQPPLILQTPVPSSRSSITQQQCHAAAVPRSSSATQQRLHTQALNSLHMQAKATEPAYSTQPCSAAHTQSTASFLLPADPSCLHGVQTRLGNKERTRNRRQAPSRLSAQHAQLKNSSCTYLQGPSHSPTGMHLRTTRARCSLGGF